MFCGAAVRTRREHVCDMVNIPLSKLFHIACIPRHVYALATRFRSGPTGCGPAAGLGLADWPRHAHCVRGKVLHCIAGMFSVFV